jgi:hypothetical protein
MRIRVLRQHRSIEALPWLKSAAAPSGKDPRQLAVLILRGPYLKFDRIRFRCSPVFDESVFYLPRLVFTESAQSFVKRWLAAVGACAPECHFARSRAKIQRLPLFGVRRYMQPGVRVFYEFGKIFWIVVST